MPRFRHRIYEALRIEDVAISFCSDQQFEGLEVHLMKLSLESLFFGQKTKGFRLQNCYGTIVPGSL
jgi:hypothetical protein